MLEPSFRRFAIVTHVRLMGLHRYPLPLELATVTARGRGALLSVSEPLVSVSDLLGLGVLPAVPCGSLGFC